jgi:2-haloalkanoic acid dehalogenase type II
VSGPDPDAFSAISFDCYGTLIDWETGILAAMLPVLERHGVRAATDDILRAYGRAEAAAEQGPYLRYREVLRRTFAGMARDLGFQARPDEAETLVDALPEFEPFSDTIPCLKTLGERYRLAVISNVDEDLFAATQERLGVRFEWVITAESAEAYKPAPLVFERALSRMGLGPDRVLHAAQSRYHDVEPARAMGIATVHVVRETGREANAVPEADAKADWTVPDLRGLVELLTP